MTAQPDTDANPAHTDDPLALAAAMSESTTTTTADDLQLIRVAVDLPASVVVDVRHWAGKLDIADALALLITLYRKAPIDRGVVVLNSQQHATICEALGCSPQTVDELVGAIVELTRISFGGLRVKFTAEEIAIINARNATGLPPKEWAEHIVRLGFEAWRNGVIG